MIKRMAAAQIEFDLGLDVRLRGVRRVDWRAVREERARFVLERMREPAAGMLDAAQQLPELEGISRDQFATMWRVMIHAALDPERSSGE